jgi:hypothetical protein
MCCSCQGYLNLTSNSMSSHVPLSGGLSPWGRPSPFYRSRGWLQIASPKREHNVRAKRNGSQWWNLVMCWYPFPCWSLVTFEIVGVHVICAGERSLGIVITHSCLLLLMSTLCLRSLAASLPCHCVARRPLEDSRLGPIGYDWSLALGLVGRRGTQA